MLLPIINWALSSLFTQAKLPRTLLVFTEIFLSVATLSAIITALLDYHLIINRVEFTPTVYVPYFVCLAIVQMLYAQQQYKIGLVFTTNPVTLWPTLLAFCILPTVTRPLQIPPSMPMRALMAIIMLAGVVCTNYHND